MGELLQVDDVLLPLRLVEPELLPRAHAAAAASRAARARGSVTALPGASRKRTKLIVTATKTVTIANPCASGRSRPPHERPPTSGGPGSGSACCSSLKGPCGVLRTRPNSSRRRPRSRRSRARDTAAACSRNACICQTICRRFATVRRHLLLRVHLVVVRVAEARVAPAAVLGAGDDREHEVRVDQCRPVPHREVEALVLVVRRRDRAKAALESSAFWFSCTPIFLKSVWMIWNVRGMLCTSVGVIDVVRHLLALRDADPARAALVAELVEDLVRELEVEAGVVFTVRVVPAHAGRGGNDRVCAAAPRRGR